MEELKALIEKMESSDFDPADDKATKATRVAMMKKIVEAIEDMGSRLQREALQGFLAFICFAGIVLIGLWLMGYFNH